jgi:hypothetical protein
MGMDLRSLAGDRYFRFNITGWTGVLEQAIAYGWKPAGTKAPGFEELHLACQLARPPEEWEAWGKGLTEEEQRARAVAEREAARAALTDEELADIRACTAAWDGRYDSNDAQQVTDEGAGNLADALESLLDEGDPLDVWRPRDEPPDLVAFRAWRDTIDLPYRVIAADDVAPETARAKLRGFIAFCRAGGFVID